MQAARIVAGIFNSRRKRKSDKYFQWVDFHSEHNGQRHVAADESVNGRALVSAAVASSGSGWRWLPGYDPLEWAAGSGAVD